MKKISMFLRNQPPGRMIVGGFAAVILFGMILLLLPISVKDGAEVSAIDALFTSTSAVCVTGLIAIDTADHFTAFGQGIVAALIQIGGLGVTSLGVGLMLVARKRVGIKSRMMVKEALNIDSYKGIVKLVKAVLLMTLCFEAGGAILSFFVFSQDYDTVHAVGISIFHSIAAFNNSGFDILGGLRNLTIYQDNVLLNLTTCILIIFGGLGFLVILDILKQKRFRKLTLHSKVVIVTSLVLLVAGTVILKLTENATWLGAFFQSVSARTAGFSTYPIGEFTNAGLFVLCILMFIGASPGSTGGGIKTSTFFIMFQKISIIAKASPKRPRPMTPYAVSNFFFILLFSPFSYPIATSSSEYLALGSVRLTHIESNVMIPTLPINITKIITPFPAMLSSGVIPVESPTVPKAETTSNRSCIKLYSGSNIHIKNTAIHTTVPESIVIINAFVIFCSDIFR